MRAMIFTVNKPSFKATLFVAAAGLAVGAAACNKDDSAEQAAAPEAEGESDVPERDALDYVIDEQNGTRYTVSFVPPKDWTEWRPRDPGTVTYQRRSSNRVVLSTTCHGNCMNLDEDFADNFASKAHDTFSSLDDKDLAVSWVAEPGEIEPGQFFYQVVGENDDGEVQEVQAELSRFEAGWARAVRCNVRITAEEMDMLDELLTICRSVELTLSEIDDE
jgi:hypothetical protein